jgi:hypothetical protein
MSTKPPNLATDSTSAKPRLANDVPATGGPTISPYARGIIAGTSIDATNNSLVHSCDFVNDLKKSLGLKKFLKAIAKWIREGVRTIMRVLGLSDPSGTFSELINMLKSVAEFIRYIQKEYIEPLIEFAKYVLVVLVKIRALIQWILSLPAKLLSLLRECLTKLLTALVGVFVDDFSSTAEKISSYTVGIQKFADGSSIQIFDDGSQLITDVAGNLTSLGPSSDIASGDIGKGFSELTAAVQDTLNVTSDALKATGASIALGAGIATSATIGLLLPTSEDQVIEANKVIKNYTGSFPPGYPAPADLIQNNTIPT